MSIKSDRWIRRMAEQHGMIEPFEPGQIRLKRHGPEDRQLWHQQLRLRHPLCARVQGVYQHPQHGGGSEEL
jgi:deoxycytidine triphosphate deaminase